MGRKKNAKDVLARALAETPIPRRKAARNDFVERTTPRAQPVSILLDALQADAKDAMPETFFDEGAKTTTTPIRKRMRSEVGTVEVSAKRRESGVEASVVIDVRCDQDEHGDAGRYQVRAEGRVSRDSDEGIVETEFPVVFDARDAQGGLTIDSDDMRERIANAIRSTGAQRT